MDYDTNVDYFKKLQEVGVPISRTSTGFMLGTPTHPADFSRCVFFKQQDCSCGRTYADWQATKNVCSDVLIVASEDAVVQCTSADPNHTYHTGPDGWCWRRDPETGRVATWLHGDVTRGGDDA